MFSVSFERAQSHFPIFLMKLQWPSLSIERKYLPKDLWNSRTIEVNDRFPEGHGRCAQNLGLSRGFRTVGTYGLVTIRRGVKAMALRYCILGILYESFYCIRQYKSV